MLGFRRSPAPDLLLRNVSKGKFRGEPAVSTYAGVDPDALYSTNLFQVLDRDGPDFLPSRIIGT
jgi:hypothetical protein